MAETERVIALIEKLRQLTPTRGATEGEADMAAFRIGKLVVEHRLTVGSAETQQPERKTPQPERKTPQPERKTPQPERKTEQQERNQGQHRKRNPDQQEQGWNREEEAFNCGMATCWGSTEKALYLYIDCFSMGEWVPRSQLRGHSSFWEKGSAGILYISQWYARKQGWA